MRCKTQNTGTKRRQVPAGHRRTVGELRDHVEALAQRAKLLALIEQDFGRRFGREAAEPERIKMGDAMVKPRREVVAQIRSELTRGWVGAWQQMRKLEELRVMDAAEDKDGPPLE